MTDPTALALLAALDTSLIVGVVTADGEPFATRCWGLRVLSETPPRVRVLVPAAAVEAMGRGVGDGEAFALAVTSADVFSLVARQAKGTASGFEPADADDVALAERYIATFLERISQIDGYDSALLDRWPPPVLVGCDVEIDDIYDQTPGPGAGARLTTAAG